jgi:predicted HTH domain antitoxin
MCYNAAEDIPMALTVTLDLPPDVEQKLRNESKNLAADVKEAYAVALFRQGKLSHYELSKMLGLDRFQTDAYLKQHNIYEGSLTMEDLEEQDRMLAEVMRGAKP